MKIQNMIFFCALLIAVLSVKIEAQDTYENCSTNYTVLEKALLETSDNAFRLTTTYFNPNVSNPIYVKVTYNFANSKYSASYKWSAASVFLSVPLQPLHYLSLLFTEYDEESSIGTVTLQLPVDCTELINVTDSTGFHFLYVLTQRLRIYAKYYHSRNCMTLPDGFEARVISADDKDNTFAYNGGTKTFFSFVIFFPIFALVMFVCIAGGNHEYISKPLNDPRYRSSQAALVCLGQTATLYFFYTDVRALNTKELEVYMDACIGLLASFEICCFVIVLFSIFFSISKSTLKPYVINLSLILPSLFLTAHIGFILVGWASLHSRGTAILLFYLFICIYFFFFFQKLYLFLVTVKTKIKVHLDPNSKPNEQDLDFTVLLMDMALGMIFLYTVSLYIYQGFEKMPVLRGTEEVITQAYSFGQYASLFIIFLLTYIVVYKRETSNDSISEDVMKYLLYLSATEEDPEAPHTDSDRDKANALTAILVFKMSSRPQNQMVRCTNLLNQILGAGHGHNGEENVPLL